MWAVWTNAAAAVMALINYFVGVSGELHWFWLITGGCFGFSAVRLYRNLKNKEK